MKNDTEKSSAPALAVDVGSRLPKPIEITVKLTVYPAEVWKAGCAPGEAGPTILLKNGGCAVLGMTAKQIYDAVEAFHANVPAQPRDQ